MCGISGFVDIKGKYRIRADFILRAMTNSLQHRGPDGAGYELRQVGTVNIGLGHRRLSILDLSEAGHQPMKKHDRELILNGEIYNFKEIRETLEQAGYRFRTATDTEVILSAYDYWGADCLNQFQGMFALVLFDKPASCLFIARDRLGVKPLFIYEREGLILFASELKAFHQHPGFIKVIDENAMRAYFTYGFVPSPLCIFQGCRKLSPGSFLTINLETGSSELRTYWDATELARKPNLFYGTEQELVDRIEEMLLEACSYRMVADVPVGVFLSGGYDSSLVTALLQTNRKDRLKTFTIGFVDEAFDESPQAEAVAKFLGTDHQTFHCTEAEAKAIIPELPKAYDEPFADSSAIPTYLLSQRAAEFVKVALSADGGDELFSGYRRNLRFLTIQKRLRRIPTPLRPLLGLIFGGVANIQALWSAETSDWWYKLGQMSKDPHLVNLIHTYPQVIGKPMLAKLSNGSIKSDPLRELRKALRSVPDEGNALLAFDYQSTLTNDMLVKVDRATMAHGLEGREPLLDHRLYEFLIGLAFKRKMPDRQLKYLLRQVVHRYLPKDLMDRPKQGFGIPIHDWLRGDLKPLLQEHLNEQRIKEQAYLNHQLVGEILNKYESGRLKTGNSQVWLLLCWQMWVKEWL
ncbi:MAG: asparagine synthase (glutamine-hydrolyzing) [Bacteroidota bacterium]